MKDKVFCMGDGRMAGLLGGWDALGVKKLLCSVAPLEDPNAFYPCGSPGVVFQKEVDLLLRHALKCT
eukprot:892188-Ditylum_brightwellii.AAC.1